MSSCENRSPCPDFDPVAAGSARTLGPPPLCWRLVWVFSPNLLLLHFGPVCPRGLVVCSDITLQTHAVQREAFSCSSSTQSLSNRLWGGALGFVEFLWALHRLTLGEFAETSTPSVYSTTATLPAVSMWFSSAPTLQDERVIKHCWYGWVSNSGLSIHHVFQGHCYCSVAIQSEPVSSVGFSEAVPVESFWVNKTVLGEITCPLVTGFNGCNYFV